MMFSSTPEKAQADQSEGSIVPGGFFLKAEIEAIRAIGKFF